VLFLLGENGFCLKLSLIQSGLGIGFAVCHLSNRQGE
jgi:hypothetical protein